MNKTDSVSDSWSRKHYLKHKGYSQTLSKKKFYYPKVYAEKKISAKTILSKKQSQEKGQASIINKRVKIRLWFFGILLIYLAAGS